MTDPEIITVPFRIPHRLTAPEMPPAEWAKRIDAYFATPEHRARAKSLNFWLWYRLRKGVA